MAAVLEREGATSPALSFYEIPVNNSTEAILANIATNLRRQLPELKQQEPTETPLAIVAGGPSLHDYLSILRSFLPDCHVLSVNGAYKFLRSVGIESDYFTLIDSRRENVVHVDSPRDGTKHYLASQVHPDVFDSLRDYDVTLFNLATETGLEATKHLPDPKSYLVSPIGMASVYAVYLAAALGYKKIFLFGYDFSHKEGETYAFEQAMNKSDTPFEVTLGGRKFKTTMALARTAEQFVRAISPLISGCKLDVRMMSSGLLPEVIKASMESTEESERAKYEDVWRVDLYRQVSPGLEDLDRALDLLKPKGGMFADFGCGTGRAVAELIRRGYPAIGVDIAANALEMDVPFVRAALWDTEKMPKVQYGFSVDVLEHIPPTRLRDTLKAIYDACEVGAYLNIDTIPDSFGVWVGRTLHETVLPGEQWEALLKEFWPEVDFYAGERQAIFVCRK
jgi:uncharacterized Rossmann fold enzyme